VIHSFPRDQRGRNEDRSANTVFALTVSVHAGTKFENKLFAIKNDINIKFQKNEN